MPALTELHLCHNGFETIPFKFDDGNLVATLKVKYLGGVRDGLVFPHGLQFLDLSGNALSDWEQVKHCCPGVENAHFGFVALD
jgi:hypothetical protein